MDFMAITAGKIASSNVSSGKFGTGRERRIMKRIFLGSAGEIFAIQTFGDHSQRETEFTLGRALACAAVAAIVDISPSDVCIGVTDLGAPYAVGYTDVSLSISHTRGLVLAGALIGEYFGIDVEWAERDVSRLTRSLSIAESNYVERGTSSVLEILVAKEAVAKSWGTGLGGGLARWPVLDAGEGWVEVGSDGGVRRAEIHRVEFADGGVPREALIATVSG